MCLTRHQFEGRTPTTPLELAAEAGKHETVAYLLSIPGVSAEGVPSDQVIHIYLACHCVCDCCCTYVVFNTPCHGMSLCGETS